MSTENHKLLLEIPNTLQTASSLNAPYLKTLNPELIIVYTHYTNHNCLHSLYKSPTLHNLRSLPSNSIQLDIDKTNNSRPRLNQQIHFSVINLNLLLEMKFNSQICKLSWLLLVKWHLYNESITPIHTKFHNYPTFFNN